MGWGDDLWSWGKGVWNDVTGVTAANTAAAAQQSGIDAAQGYMDPYQQAGAGAVGELANLTGAGGADAQAAAYEALANSPMFQGLAQQGENAMLQQSAATGGLRGGNLQGALSQYRPQMLQQAVAQQVGGLSGLANLGFQGATGSAGLATQSGDVAADLALGSYDLQSGAVKDVIGGGMNLLFGGMPMDLLSGGGGGGGIPAGGGGGPASTPDYSSLAQSLMSAGMF